MDTRRQGRSTGGGLEVCSCGDVVAPGGQEAPGQKAGEHVWELE